MDFSTALTYILKGVGSFAAGLLVTYASIIFTKIKNRIGEVRLNTFIEKCVEAAEQLYPNLGNKTGPEKLAYVEEEVRKKYKKINNEYLRTLIEAAVYKISERVKQIAKEKANQTTQVETTSQGTQTGLSSY